MAARALFRVLSNVHPEHGKSAVRATHGRWHLASVRRQGTVAPTLQQAIDDLMTQVGGQRSYKPIDYDRSGLQNILPTSQAELPKRRMSDSQHEVLVPIGSDEELREKYLSLIGGVRFGRILEDLDVFAVLVCYKHVLNPKQPPDTPSPFCIVTALVDHIKVTGTTLKPDRDIKLLGHVSWAGKSSMEAKMKLMQKNSKNEWQKILHAYFVMVARDPLNRGSAIINELVPENPSEQAMYDEGEENKNRRKHMFDQSLLKSPPTEAEREFIHELYVKTLDPSDQSFKVRMLPSNCVWMDETYHQTSILCQPQERNRFNKIFGGFIMRQAFELAWANAYIFCKARPFVIYVDDIWFRRPVEIGSLLRFGSEVIYVQDNHLLIKVNADVFDPETGAGHTTNVFYFTFGVEGSKPVPQVLPRTYGEAMLYLDGKRHYEVAFPAK